MSFNAIRENIIYAKISEFPVNMYIYLEKCRIRLRKRLPKRKNKKGLRSDYSSVHFNGYADCVIN